MQGMETIRLGRPTVQETRIRPPGSKSLTNRALLIAGFARGESRLRGCLDAQDTRLMRTCLGELGVEIHEEGPTSLCVHGRGRALGEGGPHDLYVGTAGTAARFLTGVLAATGAEGGVRGPILIDGSRRMRERPMGGLIEGLRELGADLRCPGIKGLLPLEIHPARLRGGELVLARPASSQFVSALILAATAADAPTRIVLREGVPARPYVDMTLDVLHRFGGHAGWSDAEADTLEIEPTTLQGCDYIVEPDASAGSYFLSIAAIHGGRATIPDLGSGSVQGDAGFFEVLGAMGAEVCQDESETVVAGGRPLRGCALDLGAMPDMTLTAAVVALFAEGVTTIRGVEILRHHECDRLTAAATEMRKLGARVEEHEDGLTIETPPGWRDSMARRDVTIDTYDDHRMAMAFSIMGDITIRDPSCCAKTYPRYFDELSTIGMVSS